MVNLWHNIVSIWKDLDQGFVTRDTGAPNRQILNLNCYQYVNLITNLHFFPFMSEVVARAKYSGRPHVDCLFEMMVRETLARLVEG